MNSVFSAANVILELAHSKKEDITPIKLLKLCYIAHGWMLALENRPLFDNRIEAWQYGPVIPDLYHSIKHFGRDPMPYPYSIYQCLPVEDDASDLIESVYDEYSRFTGLNLSSMTHEEGSPWKEVYNGESFTEIPRDIIKEHYSNLLKSRTKDG